MSPSDAEWQVAVDAIHGADRLVVSCHVNPDGDALGSALALHLALRGAGRHSTISFSEPFTVPPAYRFLGTMLDELTAPTAVPAQPDLFVSFDAGSLDRLGTLVPTFERARRTLVVDHHASNPGFGDLNLIDPSAPASAVLCRELLRRLDLPLDQDIATALYLGVVTDTGRFQYQATNADTHRLAAELLDHGVRQYEIATAVFETNPVGYLRLLADALGRLRQEPEASLVWTMVTQDDLRTHGLDLDQTEGLIDVVRTDAASDVALVLKEQPGGGWRGSMRSRGKVDVSRVATHFDGGGHVYAAGFTSPLDAEATAKAVADLLVAG